MPGGLIVIVEDDEDLLDFYRESLNAVGYRVLDAKSGENALNLLARHKPRVLVLDIDLPGLDGIEVCRQARKMYTASMPILFITGNQTLSILEKCIAAGGDDFICKSSGQKAMLERIAYWAKSGRRTIDFRKRDNALDQMRSEIESVTPTRAAERAIQTAREPAADLEFTPDTVSTRVRSQEDLADAEALANMEAERQAALSAAARAERELQNAKRLAEEKAAEAEAAKQALRSAEQRANREANRAAELAKQKKNGAEKQQPVASQPISSDDLTHVVEFVVRAFRGAPKQFDCKSEAEKLVLLGYMTGVVNGKAKSSLAMKMQFMDYLTSAVEAVQPPEIEQFRSMLSSMYSLYENELFLNACHTGEDDFDKIGNTKAVPRGFFDLVETAHIYE